MLNYYKFIISYDGTDYAGWQSQGTGNTVCEVLLKAFLDVFKAQCSLRGVSRTDAGVHALGQVILLKTSVNLDPKKMAFAWNNRLPASIVVQNGVRVAPDFRLHANILEKTYLYHFCIEQPQPFKARYAWYFQKPLDLNKLNAALQLFVGTHDFRSYCTGDDWEDTVRTIHSIELNYLPWAKMYRITIKGPRFLRYMIRRIVGACLQIASNSYVDIDILQNIMQQKNPQQALLNAPPSGLLLFNIRYEGEGQANETDLLSQIF
jgi:tRNA pseudouridine38-40 synthase